MAFSSVNQDDVVLSPDTIETMFGDDFLRTIVDSLYDGVFYVNLRRRVLFWNKGAERLTGYTCEDMFGRELDTGFLGVDGKNAASHCPLKAALDGNRTISSRLFLQHKGGRRVAVDTHLGPVRNDQNETIGAVAIFRDASSALALEAAYENARALSSQDALTAISNRRHLDQMLGEHLGVLNRTGIRFSLLMADLDHFKRINDTYGHAAGDKSLVQFAKQLQHHCRASDVVGRFGGDEFMILLSGRRLRSATEIANRIRQSVEDSSWAALPGRVLTSSFGVTEVIAGDSAESLLERVDAALYHAKRNGRNRVEITDPACDKHPCPPLS